MPITIKRLNEYMGQMLDFKVFLDDELIINIHNDETVTLDIPSGSHKIFLEVNEIISKKVKFEISEYEDLNFVCGFSKPRVGKLLAGLLFATKSGINSYIQLEEDDF